MNFIEQIRKALIIWNVAPLSIVGFLCWVIWTMVQYYKSTACTIDSASQAAIFAFIAGALGILYKMYDSMQKDRGDKEEKDE